MQFTLNGRVTEVPLRDGATLLEVLREGCGLRSMKDGCAPEGSCGACTVIVDGKAVVSCAQPAERAAGRSVVTQEGLSDEVRALWADAFVATGAAQCGFCSPGIVMKGQALLDKRPAPSRDEIAHALAGNLCRCTGYVKIIDAVQAAAAARRGDRTLHIDRSGRVGSRTGRYEGELLALGDRPFVNDLVVPEMLHGAIRFAERPRARILRIDTAKAEAHRGVVAVITWQDVPGERMQGVLTRDWRQFVAEGEITSYVGDVLAAVAAETRHAAREAAALIEIEYEVLPPVTDPFEALAAGAPRAAPGRQPALDVRGQAGRRRGRPPRRRARGDRDLPNPVRRARVPGARVLAGRPRARRRRGRLASTSTRRVRASGRTAGRWPRCSASPEGASA